MAKGSTKKAKIGAVAAKSKVKVVTRFKSGAAPARRTAPATKKAVVKAVKQPKAEVSTRSESKQAQVIALLRSETGTTVAQIGKAMGWKSHTVRGLLSGLLRKKLRLPIVSERVNGERVYRIAAGGGAAVPALGAVVADNQDGGKQDRGDGDDRASSSDGINSSSKVKQSGRSSPSTTEVVA